ncbi:unnamed protein product [Calypogeia fissa]
MCSISSTIVTVGNSATLPRSLLLACRESNDAAQTVVTHFRAIKPPSSSLVKPEGRAGKTQIQGRYGFCAAAAFIDDGQESAISSSGGDDEVRKWTSSKSSGSKARRLEYDVVIVGAGIIGLATAHHILFNTNLSVALIDAAEPCAGATGAGQGYIWMCHRTPGSPGWALASRSKVLWEELAAEIQAAGVDPLRAMGWKNTGSVLVASTTEEAELLQKTVSAFLTAGVPAEYMSAMDARKAEPALSPDHLTGAALFPEDSQIDASLTVKLLQQRIRGVTSSGRYKELFQNPALRFLRSTTEGHIQGVQIQGGEVFCKKAVVVATGAWSSALMATASAEWGLPIVPPVKPRKGHLLVLGRIENVQLRHGIMECEYLSHSRPSHVEVVEIPERQDVLESSLELAMTATLDQNGNLLLGSSREFVGFDVNVHPQVVESILNRARKFLWGLSHVSLEQALQTGRVRTGLRPFVADGRPLIGGIDDVPGLIFATGHEGSGLCLALATAEMVANAIQGIKCTVDGTVDRSFFSPVGRLLPLEINS